MTQHLLIQAEVTPPVIKTAGASKPLSSDNTEVQPFSSELDKQIDKHAKTQENVQEPVEKSANAHTAKKQNQDPKAEKGDDDDGKNLPKETTTSAEKQKPGEPIDTEVNTEATAEAAVLINTTAPVSVTVDTKNAIETVDEGDIDKTSVKQGEAPKQKIAIGIVATPETEQVKQTAVKAQDKTAAVTKTTNTELPLTAKATTVKQDVTPVKTDGEVKAHIKESSALTDDKKAVKKTTVDVNAQSTVKSQQTGATLKAGNIQQQEIITVAKGSSQTAVEGLASDQKKQATALRPDILYGIKKKYAAEGVKSDLAGATEKVMTSERVATKALSEGQLMADVVKQVKPGLQQATATTVSPGGLVTAHTPAATVSQGPATPATPILDIQPALQTAAWNRVVSGRVVWMAREGVQQAELKLNPAKLGPVEVRLTMNNEQTSVTFIANHAATRDALEQALPKLRESFSENGMELTDAEVSQHSSEEQHQDDAAETDGSGIVSEQSSAESEEFSGEEQPENNEQEELDIGLSIYA